MGLPTRLLACLLPILLCGGAAHATQPGQGISIQATDEQPQVLYVVPWRAATEGNSEEAFPVTEAFRELAAPLDGDSWLARERFRKTLELTPESARADW